MLAKPQKLTVDEFISWSMDQESGRYELVDGVIYAQAAERTRHAEVKHNIAALLKSGIKASRAPCFMLPDGMAVRVSERTVYEPDALVYCGEKLAGDALVVTNPIIVVEVLSPGTKHIDKAAKLLGYFSIATVQHYLIVDAEKQMIIHHARASGDLIETRIVGEGELRLDPPGVALPVCDVFA